MANDPALLEAMKTENVKDETRALRIRGDADLVRNVSGRMAQDAPKVRASLLDAQLTRTGA